MSKFPQTKREFELPHNDGLPLSLDVERRTVDVVAATETPVTFRDYTRGEYREILLMEGAQLPQNRRIPLLNSHWNQSIESVIGSARDLRIVNGELWATVEFAETPEAATAWDLTRQGHARAYSVGYLVHESEYIPPGGRREIAGREFVNDSSKVLEIAARWEPKELSICPIGKDPNAQARAETNIPEMPRQALENTDNMAGTALPNNGGENMEKTTNTIRNFLEARGLPADASPETALEFLKKFADMPDPAETASRAADAERARIQELRGIGASAHLPESAITDAIERGIDAAEMRKIALDHLIAEAPQAPAIRDNKIDIVVDERDKFRGAATDSILLRGGRAPERTAPGAADLRGYSMVELAREALRIAGQSNGGGALEVVGRALSTSDLPIILSSAAERSLQAGYETQAETWRTWCGTGSVADFRIQTLVRASETDDLDEIPEGGEYQYGNLLEASEQFKLATYGKLFAVTRQALINDDLNVLTEIPAKHGAAWARKIGDLAYAVLIANAAMGDGINLFDATDHNNVGTAGAIGTDTLAEAIRLMKMQKDEKNLRRLNIQPQYLITSVANEAAAETFFQTLQWHDTDTSATRKNIYAGNLFTRVYDPRLDDADPAAWYIAGPKGHTVNLYFLNGVEAPYLETKQGWNIDGTEFKVRGDACAKAVDWRALVYNAGA